MPPVPPSPSNPIKRETDPLPISSNRLGLLDQPTHDKNILFRATSELSGYKPTFSPDGKLVAFNSEEGNTAETYHFKITVIPAEGGAALHAFAIDPRLHIGASVCGWNFQRCRIHFTPDSKGLAWPINEGGVGNIWVLPLAGGPAKQFTAFPSEMIEDFAYSHDGKSIALLRGRVTKDVVLIKDTGR